MSVRMDLRMLPLLSVDVLVDENVESCPTKDEPEEESKARGNRRVRGHGKHQDEERHTSAPPDDTGGRESFVLHVIGNVHVETFLVD